MFVSTPSLKKKKSTWFFAVFVSEQWGNREQTLCNGKVNKKTGGVWLSCSAERAERSEASEATRAGMWLHMLGQILLSYYKLSIMRRFPFQCQTRFPRMAIPLQRSSLFGSLFRPLKPCFSRPPNLSPNGLQHDILLINF